MTTDKVLTVLVPAYNAEKYLRTNLESLCIPDLLSKLEVIIVNDGSTDGTREIAESYEEEYPDSFRLINKENGGHGSCINTGISKAAGRYFKVVDADDWVVEEDFRELMNCLEKSTSDIVSSGFLWAYDNGEDNVDDFKIKTEIPEPFKGVQYGKEYSFDDVAEKLYIKMHNLTIKTEILRQMSFSIDEHCYYVDYEYVSYPIPYVQTITFLSNMVYRYRIGSEGQSVDIDQMIAHAADVDKVLDSLFRFYDKLGIEIPCTEQKRHYIAGMIARLAASKVKIYLCEPESEAVKKKLMSFDLGIKNDYPEVYKANQNNAIKMLRGSNFHLYSAAAKAAKKQYDV